MKKLKSGLLASGLTALFALSLAGCEGMMSTASTFEDARTAYEKGQYRIANAHLVDLLASGVDTAEVRKLQLDLMLKMGDGNRAIAALEQLPETKLGGVDRRLALAHAQILQGAPEKTAKIYEPLLEEEYTEQDFRMVLWALRDMGDEANFASGMDYALEKFPNNPYLNALAADQLYDLNLPQEANAFADAAMENGSDIFEVQMVKGRKAIFAGELEEAISHYKRANEINSHMALPISNVVGLYLDLDKTEEAGEALKIALNNHGGYPFLQWQAARYNLSIGDLQAARAAKERVDHLFKDDPEFILLMAQIEEAFGNTGLALDNYRRFVRLAGEQPAVMLKIKELEG